MVWSVVGMGVGAGSRVGVGVGIGVGRGVLRRTIIRVVAVTGCALAMQGAQAEVRALLVGVSVYPHLPGQQLDGVVNDLRLMRNVVGRLGVRPDKVTELSEAAGPAMWPTRSRILQALDQLAQASGPGDWAVVYFAGHGAQVPQTPVTRRGHAEADGLDEVFLPRDTTRWVPARGVVDGAIVDDEFGRLLDAIRARGAYVWAVFDTCHAGDITRAGGPAEDGAPVWRRVTAGELGVDLSSAQAALERRQWRDRRQQAGAPHPDAAPARAGRKTAAPLRAAAPQTVAFFASQADEPAAEEWFVDPLDGQTRRRFGVFTYLLHRAIVHGPDSFAGLARAVEEGYQDRPFPTPQFSGDLARRLLGWRGSGPAGKGPS